MMLNVLLQGRAVSAPGGPEMDRKQSEFMFFNPRPVGEPVNSYVFRIEPQREPDYSALQRSLKESAQRIAAKKLEE